MLTRISDLMKTDSALTFLERLRREAVDCGCIDFLNRLEIWCHTGAFIDPEKTNCIEATRRMPDMPILFITGESDVIAPVADTEVMLHASQCSESELKIIKGAGYGSMVPRQKLNSKRRYYHSWSGCCRDKE